MTRDEQYVQALGNMERTVHHLASRIDPPEWRLHSRSVYGFRYAEKGAIQAIVQKMARVVSGLRAAHILLTQGYAQEHAALCRMVDESSEDITFLSLGMIHGETDLHKRFLEDFYLEEFEDASRPAQTRIKRPNTPRDRIHAYLTSNPSAGPDPSSSKAMLQAIHKTFSGFVHGASPHIMETYGGPRSALRFHMTGMLGTRLWQGYADSYWSYLYRGMSSFRMVAKAIGDEPRFRTIRDYLKEFEQTAPQ
ncbi:hypothetical protein [Paraburkholderia sp. BCC1885]|uniref:hypothetical protein n=1 Tax=Paraburkholderia sp. BCC1885 TaxID=2562669 RepID=UPI0021B4B15A|nr:hypothetical protein [Paraburkholderia sp. BCC1885]